MRRKLNVFLACLLLTTVSILVGYKHFAGDSPFRIDSVFDNGWFSSSSSNSANSTVVDESSKTPQPSNPDPPGPPLKDGNSTLLEIATTYIKAIMTPEDNSFPRLDCPAPSGGRYQYLRSNETNIMDGRLKYFFALDLHQCANLLPRLLGSIVETIRFLGPEHCALSVVEGRSDDGTFEILKLLRTEIENIGAKYHFSSNDVDPMAGQRIAALAELRNLALEPMITHPEQYSANTTVVFLNDVAVCMEDILELIHQRVYQNADMTCGMDWTYVGHDPTFYDVWIARGMNGDSFFDIPAEDANWNSAWNLFWNNPETLQQFNSHKPFQAFSCWNGATAFTAEPLLEHKIKFRSSAEGECIQGEPQLFCKELWHLGYGKIAVVPSVNLEYSDEAAKKIKDLKGYTSQWVDKDGESDASMQIEWKATPPANIRCFNTFNDQTWVPWDEYLV